MHKIKIETVVVISLTAPIVAVILFNELHFELEIIFLSFFLILFLFATNCTFLYVYVCVGGGGGRIFLDSQKL